MNEPQGAPTWIPVNDRVTGLPLDHFFDVWLFQEGRPEPNGW